MAQTLDQKRAEFAWKRASQGVTAKGKSYVNMTKGASAFIMSNGLMQALAFYKSRTGSNSEEAKLLLEDILLWIDGVDIFRGGQGDFPATMNALFKATSMEYMRATQEALAMLRWLRQFADALKPSK